MPLTADEILNHDDMRIETVRVPEWGEDAEVCIRVMTAGQRDEIESSFIGEDGKVKNVSNLRAKMVAKCLCDDTGKRLFNDGQVGALALKSGAAMDRIYEAAKKLNRMFLSDAETKELEKNFGNGQRDDSSFISLQESLVGQSES